MVDARSNSTGMTYKEFINSSEVKTYFGSRYAKWAPQLVSMATKKFILDDEISDQTAYAKLFQTIKFSWLGLFFGLFWYAYHNGKGWQAFVAALLAIHLIDIAFLDGAYGGYISGSTSLYFALVMKGWIFASKANELSTHGRLTPGSWSRVLLALTLFFGTLILATIFLA